MRLVIQRVKKARVLVNAQEVGAIEGGILVFLGVAKADTKAETDQLVNKLVELRIFDDQDGKMNLSAKDKNASFLVVSQFTVLANADKGRRPSFDEAAPPSEAESLYEYFIEGLKKHQVRVACGRFRAMMDVSLVNDGPVTFIMDSK